MSDRYERECERREQIQHTKRNEDKIATEAREVYPYVRKYRKLIADLGQAGYRIEENGDVLKIWKEI